MKKLCLVLFVLFILVAGTGCSNKTEETSAEKEITIKIRTSENEEHGQGVFLTTFKNELEKLSNGSIKVQTYFNDSLYTADGAIPALISGELEMDVVSFQQTADYLPSIAMLGSTYMFKNYDHARNSLDGEIGDEIANQIKEAAGYIPVAYIYNGSRQLNLRSTDPVTKPENLSSTILRMPNTEAWIAVGESLGAKVAPLAYSEVYTALQTGTIDAQDNPMPSVKTMKFYEVTDQLCLTYHVIDIVLPVMNAKLWDSLTEEQQEWVKQAATTAQKACDEVQLELESELIDFFKSEGLIITNPDINAFSTYAHNYYEENNLMSTWDMDLYNKIQDLAK